MNNTHKTKISGLPRSISRFLGLLRAFGRPAHTVLAAAIWHPNSQYTAISHIYKDCRFYLLLTRSSATITAHTERDCASRSAERYFPSFGPLAHTNRLLWTAAAIPAKHTAISPPLSQRPMTNFGGAVYTTVCVWLHFRLHWYLMRTT